MQITSGYGANKIHVAGQRCQRTRNMKKFAWNNYGLLAHGSEEGIREW